MAQIWCETAPGRRTLRPVVAVGYLQITDVGGYAVADADGTRMFGPTHAARDVIDWATSRHVELHRRPVDHKPDS